MCLKDGMDTRESSLHFWYHEYFNFEIARIGAFARAPVLKIWPNAKKFSKIIKNSKKNCKQMYLEVFQMF